MPISDEVIELAPVKKTKKTLIIMIAAMGAMFALAVAFLVMYLIKPSVTEDKNHVKDITLVSTELFSEADGDGSVKYYASIGNEYTVYSTLTVDNNSSTNVQWDCDPDLLEITGQSNTGEPFLKFIPRVGMHGKTAKITVRAPSQVSEYKTIEFTIVNQGAEDIQVTQYGVRGNLTTVTGDSIEHSLSITVPYYTMSASKNNQPIQVKFQQLTKQDPTSKEYAKLTSVETEKNGPMTDDVTVTSSDESVISINQDTVSNEGFSFNARKYSNQPVTITIKANVYNGNCGEITKTISVKVDSNGALGYVDSMYVFNKPIVDEAFIGKVLADDKTYINSQKLKEEIAKDRSVKYAAYNDSQVLSNSDFELVLPYSNNNSITYNDIFKHILLNPINIQYKNDEVTTDWYKNIDVSVKSADSSILQVNTNNTTGEVRLYPRNVATKVELTFKDKKQGSAGASITVPVRIIAQTTDVELAYGNNKTSATHPDIEVAAAAGSKYEVNVNYLFTAPSRDNAKTLWEENCLNTAYTLDFDTNEMEVKLKGETKASKPNEEQHAEFGDTLVKVAGSSGASTQYKATITFEVTVKKDTSGAATFTFIKNGSDIFGTDDSNSLKSKDKAVELSASFQIKESATKAWFIKSTDDEGIGYQTALNLVTDNGTQAGNFVCESDTVAKIYVQNRTTGTQLTVITPENLAKLVKADKADYKVEITNSSSGGGVTWNFTDKKMTFNNGTFVASGTRATTVSFEVKNVGNDVIGTFQLEIYIIDAVTNIRSVESKPTVQYDANANASITLAQNDITVTRVIDDTAKPYSCDNVNLYYGNGVAFDKVAAGNGNYIFKYVNSEKHEDKELYRYETGSRRLSILTDIYAYSYEQNINFGEVDLECLLKADEEYIGKHFERDFDYKYKTHFEFERISDDAALFTDSNHQNEVTLRTDNSFNVSVNQATDAGLYATSIVNITVSDGENSTKSEKVYVERDNKGHIAPIQKATFTLPPEITPANKDESSSQGYYYSITYRSPAITQSSATYTGAHVYYGSTTSQKSYALTFTVNNATRQISSIGIFSDAACNNSLTGKSLLFGGFINQSNKYSNIVYVKVVYDTKQDSHTAFEDAELILPDYLQVSGETKLNPPKKVDEVDEWTFTCVIVLKKDATVTDAKTIEVVPSNQRTSGKSVRCTVDVQAGLKNIVVKINNEDIATIGAGDKGIYSTTFNLKRPSDYKSLVVSFEYGATNDEGYSLNYDNTGAGLQVAQPTVVNGFAFTNHIKTSTSSYTIATTDGIATGTQTFTLTLTDTYNGTSANNVFTLEITITVTMDIYELAFEDGISTAVTVTGETTGAQTITIPVVYNGGTSTTQPTAVKNVLGVYVLNDITGQYEAVNNGITVATDGIDTSGKTFTVSIPNNVDRSQQYYLRLVYDNVTYNGDVHLRSIVISTLTSHIEFDKDNSIKPVQGELCPEASIVVQSASDSFTLVANVVNDGSGSKESADKQNAVNYGLYTDLACNNAASGFTVNKGIITVTNPPVANGTVYYRAKYEDEYIGERDPLIVKINYTVAPSAAAINGVDANAFNSANDTLTLYYGNATNYTQADLSGKIVASTAFGVTYTTEQVTYAVALKNAGDSAYLDISGFVLKPKALKNNALTTVPVAVTATYAGVTTDEKVYNVIITPFAALTQGSGELNLLNSNSQLIVTPNIAAYGGFTHTYTLTPSASADGLFTITGNSDAKTVKFATGTQAKKGPYTLTETVNYAYAGAANGGITVVGTFTSTATYTVTVVGDYSLTFNLMAGNDVITPYVSTDESTKYPVVNESLNYSVKVTSADTGFVATSYSATVTPNVVSVGTFSGKNAAVTLTPNSSGAFAITVTAKVGGQTYTFTKNYYFVYGANVGAKLYTSQNGAAYTEFNGESLNIDYTTTAYTFKYEIAGIPNGVNDSDIRLVVNGDVGKGAMQKDGNKRYWIITAAKPTTMRIGASVKIGSRTVYLDEKTVELIATAPEFTFNPATTVWPNGTIDLSVTNSANGFIGEYNVAYSVESGDAYATINGSTLKAAKDVVTDQTVIVRATITVQNGVYADRYTIDKSVTVKGVALPTIEWKANANKELYLNGKSEFTYSTESYTFADNGSYSYTDKVTIEMSAENGTLTKGTDYTFNAADRKITLIDNNKTRAGGSLQLTVTATINSGAHQGESVTDTITVRVLPIMNETASNIAIGNAAGTYDLNGNAFKSTFAPNTYSGAGFVRPTDSYSIVSLSVDDTVNFSVDGAKLIVKNNLAAATTVNVEATVLITAGAYAGTTVVGTKAIYITVPTAQAQNVAWNSTNNNYDSVTLTKTGVLGSGNAISGTVTGITVGVAASVAEYVTVANNGTARPEVSVSKDYGAYFTATAPTKTFTVNYVVTLNDGNVYFTTAQYTVAPQRVTITAKVGEESVGASGITVNANETFIMQLVAGKGFDVVITAVSANSDFNATYGGNGVQFNIGSVNSDQEVTVTLALNVAGQPTQFEFKLNILAPQTNAQYTANNTDNINFAVNDGNINQDNAVTSVWTMANNAQYKYGQMLTITAPNGHTLNEYFDSLNLEFNRQSYSATLTDNSATINFPTSTNGWGMTVRPEVGSFKLNMAFKTNAPISLSTIEVKLTVYNKNMSGGHTDVTVRYRVQVIGEVAVTLNANAGADTVEVDYDNPLYKHSYNLPELTRTGYTLVGWYTAEKGGSKVEYNAIVANTQPHTLYAHWSAKEYTIEYNNNGTITTRAEKAKYGSTYGELLTPTRDGYDFVGWKDSAGNVITADTLVNPANANSVTTITLTAQWSIRYYTVTLNAGDGTLDGTNATMTAQVPHGGSFTLHNAIVPTRDGYRFNDWTASGNTSNVTGDVELTAQWTQLYTVSFDANAEGDEIADPQPVQIANGDAYGTLPTLTRDGYTFDGWFTEATGGNEVTSATIVSLTANQTLHAHWTQVVFAVTLDADGGKIMGDSSTYVTNVATGQSYDLHLMITPTRSGYRFDGWYDSEDEKQESAITVTDDVTLTAKWIKLYTVSFDLNNDESTATYASMPYDENAVYGTLPTPADTATKNFAGWSLTQNGSVIDVETATVSGADAQITLYAQWTNADSYTVTFDSCVEGLTVEPATKTVYKDRTYGDLPTLTRADYTFDGWFTEATGDNEVTSETVVNLSEDQTLHAHWTKVVFTVSFNADVEGMDNPQSVKVTNGGKYGYFPTLTRDGYVLGGWYNGDEKVETGDTVNLTADVTLTAQWTANTYSVTFDLNGNTTAETPNGITVTYGQAYGELPALGGYTDGDTTYTFDGWYKAADGNDNVTSDTVVSSIGGHTLYAHWTEVTEEPTV